MNCIRCDAVIPDRSKFCPKCGAVQVHPDPSAAEAARPDAAIAPAASPEAEVSSRPEAGQDTPAQIPEEAAQIPEEAAQIPEQAAAPAPEEAAPIPEEAAPDWEHDWDGTEPDWSGPETEGYEPDPLQFEPDSPPPEDAETVPPQVGEAEHKAGKLATLAFGFGVLVVVAAAVLILILFLSKQQSKPHERPSGQTAPTAPAPTQTDTPVTADTEDPLATEYDPGVPDPDVDCAGEYVFTVWVPAAEKELCANLIQRFNEENTDGIVIHPTLVAVEPDKTVYKLLSDPENGADLFCLDTGRLEELVRRGLLSPLPAGSAAAVRTRDDALSVSLAAVSSRIWAYPLCCDGPVLYYDNTVIAQSDLGNLDALLQACAGQDKLLAVDLSAGDTLAAFYLASGVNCSSVWTVNENGDYVSCLDDLESESGVLALRGLRGMLNAPAYRAVSTLDILDRGAAVLAAPASISSQVRAKLGERFGVVTLPAFGVDGKAHHMGAYTDGTLLAVANRSDYEPAVNVVLHKLAVYLTDETAQTERHTELGLCPTNRAAQEAARGEDPVAEALLGRRSESVRRGPVPAGWDDVARKLIDETGKVSAEEDEQEVLMELLRRYTDRVRAILMTDATRSDYTAMGTIHETAWDTDFPLYEIRPGYCVSEVMFLKEGENFKVRQGGKWDRNFGVDGQDGKNCWVDADGWYCIWFDEKTGCIGIEPRPNPAAS